MSGETPSASGSSGSEIKKEKEDDQGKVEESDESSDESSKEIPDESSPTKDPKAEGGAAGGSGVDDVTQGMLQLKMPPQDKSKQTSGHGQSTPDKPPPNTQATVSMGTDKKMACLFRIKDGTEDFVYYTYRAVRSSRSTDLEKMIYFQKERLLDIRSDFPKARIIAFMYNDNWDKRMRGVLVDTLSTSYSRKKGVNDTHNVYRNRNVYRVNSTFTTTDLLRTIRHRWMAVTMNVDGRMADYSDWLVYDCSQTAANGVRENSVFIKLIMACIFRIPDDPTDLIYITHLLFDNHEECCYQETTLDSVRCRRVFPNAKLIAFVYRSYWEKKADANPAMIPFCEHDGPFVLRGKGLMVYRLKPGTRNDEILRGIRSEMTYGRMADYTDDQRRVYDCSRRDANGEAVIVSDDDVFIDTTIPASDESD